MKRFTEEKMFKMLADSRGALKKKTTGGNTTPNCENGYYWNPDTQSCEPIKEYENLNEDQKFLIEMANSPLFEDRYNRMIGKQLQPIPYANNQESYNLQYPADLYRRDMINNIASVKYAPVGEGDFDPEHYVGKILPGAYYMPKQKNAKDFVDNYINDFEKNASRFQKWLAKEDLEYVKNSRKEFEDKTHKIYTSKDENRPYTRLHETKHASTEGLLDTDYDYKAKVHNPFILDNPIFGKKKIDLKNYSAFEKYYSDPVMNNYLSESEEISGRKSEIEKAALDNGWWDPRKENFTKKHYDLLLQKARGKNNVSDALDDLLFNYTEDEVIKIFNDIVSNNPKDNLSVAKDGGKKKDDDAVRFSKFVRTLPDNLRNTNTTTYNLYGMWEASGKPDSFEQVQDTELFPLQEDDSYHGFSVGNDGMFLKSKKHPSAWQEYMVSQLNPELYNNYTVKANPEGYFGENQLQYQPNTPEGWVESIRSLEHQIGDPSQWTMEDYNRHQNKLNEYKNWRENTEKGRAVIDNHNEPNEYVDPLPPHLLNKKAYGGDPSLPNITGHYKQGGWLDEYDIGGINDPINTLTKPTFSDSLALYNNALAKMNFYKNKLNYKIVSDTKDYSVTNFKDPEVRKKLITEAEKHKNKEIPEYVFQDFKTKNVNKYKGEKRVIPKVQGTNLTQFGDIISGEVDNYFNPEAPPILLHPSIAPQGTELYLKRPTDGEAGDRSDVPYYDPIAVKPNSMLTDAELLDRIKKYGTEGIPKGRVEKIKDFKKKEQNIIPDRIEPKEVKLDTINNEELELKPAKAIPKYSGPPIERRWDFNSGLGTPVMIYHIKGQEVGREYYDKDGKVYQTDYGHPSGSTRTEMNSPFDPMKLQTKKYGGELDKFVDGGGKGKKGTKENPVELPEVTITPETNQQMQFAEMYKFMPDDVKKAIAYDQENPDMLSIPQEEQSYLGRGFDALTHPFAALGELHNYKGLGSNWLELNQERNGPNFMDWALYGAAAYRFAPALLQQLAIPATINGVTIPGATLGNALASEMIVNSALRETGLKGEEDPSTIREWEKYSEGSQDLSTTLANTGMNALEALSFGELRGYKPVKFSKQIPSEQIIESTEAVIPKPWQMEEMPGLHIKATMKGSPLEKNLSKTGEINVKNIEAYINKSETPLTEKHYLQKVLNEKFAGQSKIDYNDFRKAVSEEFIPLNKTVIPDYQHSNWGLGRLGYPTPKTNSIKKSISFAEQSLNDFKKHLKMYNEYANDIEKYKKDFPFVANSKTDSEIKSFIEKTISDYKVGIMESENQILKNQKLLSLSPLENETFIFSNKEKFGRGDTKHFDDPATLGHTRTLVSREEPDVMYLLESQSDFYQAEGKTILDKLKNRPKETILEKRKQQLQSLEETIKYNEELLDDIKERFAKNLPDRHGDVIHPSYIEMQQKFLARQKEDLILKNAEIKNWEQKSHLGKGHQERFLQENVQYAAEKGKNKVRVPTSETAAKIQGYESKSKWNIDYKVGDKVILNDGSEGVIIDDTFANSVDIAINGEKVSVDMISKNEIKPLHVKKINNEDYKLISAGYEPEHQTILKKYDEQPKLIKKLFGKEPIKIIDSKGNEWYEFNIPESFKQGKAEFKAFKFGGNISNLQKFIR